MNRYLVTLKPVESFFFGEERVFGFRKGESDKDKLENNIIKSKLFPQQTSILGMLRKEILIKKQLIKDKWDYTSQDKEKIIKAIGKESFYIGCEPQDFGHINKISPIFLAEFTGSNYRFLMQIPKDHKKGNKKYDPLTFNKDSKCKVSFGGVANEEEVYLPIEFVAKNGVSEDYIDINDGQVVNSENIFIADNQIGIKLNSQHKTDEDSVFRLVKYRFNYDKRYEIKNKAFVFTVDLDDEIDFAGYKNTVSLGGEGSYFNITFEKVDFEIKDKIKCLNTSNGIYKKLILLSDTYITSKDYNDLCVYSIGKSVSFRNLKSPELKPDNKDYYKRFKRSSSKYTFLEKGSVLFAEHDKYEELKIKIENKSLQKIGYNEYI